MSLITVKLVPKSQSFGILDKKTNKMVAKYDGCHEKWIPGLSKTTGLRLTGLTPEKEKQFEASCRLPTGTLAPNSPYWDTFFLIFGADGMQLNTEIPEHELYYTLLKADPTVFEGPENAVLSAKIEYQMFTEKDTAVEKNNKRDILAKCMAIYSALSLEEIIDILFMYGKEAKNLSMDVAKGRLGDLMEENPVKFLAICEDDKLKSKVWLMKLLKAGILIKHGQGAGTNLPIYFGEILLGTGLDEATTYLAAPANQNTLIALKKLMA